MSFVSVLIFFLSLWTHEFLYSVINLLYFIIFILFCFEVLFVLVQFFVYLFVSQEAVVILFESLKYLKC